MSQKLVQDENGEFVWVDSWKAKKPGLAVPKPVEGEAMGCIESQVEQMRVDAKLSGYGDIEFVPDQDVYGFYNMRAPNAERWRKYAEHCGYVDKNGQYEGKRITRDELESAERLIRSRYPKQEAV
jgi:hypothetical protein